MLRAHSCRWQQQVTERLAAIDPLLLIDLKKNTNAVLHALSLLLADGTLEIDFQKQVEVDQVRVLLDAHVESMYHFHEQLHG